MTIIYAAATVPVNPAGTAPVLSIEQLWRGLEIKVRKPQLFIPVIDTCEVLEDTEESVLREVLFKNVPGAPPGKAQERITHFRPIAGGPSVGVESFDMVGAASRVLNIVSLGADGEMYLTFTFEWDHPDVTAGSPEAVKKAHEYQAMAPVGASSTLSSIRSMAEKGEL